MGTVLGFLGWLNPLNLLSGSNVGLSTILGALLGIALLIRLFRWRPMRRLILLFVATPPAIMLYLVGLIALVLWRPVNWLTDRLLRYIPLDQLISKILYLPSRISKEPLLTGDREAHAKRMWPPSQFPELYTAAPADIRRPPYEDGRLLGGYSLNWLADRFLTDSVYRSSVRAGFKAGVLFFCLMFLAVLSRAFASVLTFIPALFGGDRLIIEQWPGEEPVRTSAWSLFMQNLGHALPNLFGHLGILFLYIPAAILMAIGAAILVSLLPLRVWFREQAAPYELVTKDAVVRWPYRIESRQLIRQTYLRQLDHAAKRLTGQPTYHLGYASGILRARGDLAGPTPGQPLKLDRESLFQHTLVFGGTGEGKTTAILKPLVEQVLADKSFGAFVVDAKGVLWRDMEAIARRVDRSADVIVVGTGAGQSGINIMANLNPSQVAAALRSVLVQIGGESENGFWQDMAASVLRHALTIGLGYAQTPEGAAEKAKGLHPYSLWWAYQAVLRKPVMDGAIAVIRREAEQLLKKQQAAAKSAPIEEARRARDALTHFMTAELSDSIAYLESAWRDMAPETKSGIVANVTQLLDGLAGSPTLRGLFASGRDEGTVPITAALDGKLVLIALSSIEDGLPARLISILLKTSLYREARRREERHRRDKTSTAPQDKPCLVVMDEVQELVTVDPTSGLSDGTFWNVARSTGLAGLFATQTMAALTQAMGASASNFVQQARSKVFFRTEEQETVNYACWCAGQYERNRVFDEDQRESLDYRLLIDGWNPLGPVDEEATLAGGAHVFFDAAKGLIDPDRVAIGHAQNAPTYAADTRFIATDATPGEGGGTGGNSARMGSLQAASWRAEDLSRKFRSEGNQLQAALSSSDLIHMGRWHAFAHIQRAGATRQDIITVEHDFRED